MSEAAVAVPARCVELVLPNRRCAVRETWKAKLGGSDHVLTVNFGLMPDADGGLRVVEAFCCTGKEGSDLRAAITDGCIALSRAIRHGDAIADLATAFGEDRDEGAASGPPSSYLGAIAQRGAEIERWVNTLTGDS